MHPENNKTLQGSFAEQLVVQEQFLVLEVDNPVRFSGHYMYQQVEHSTVLRSAHTLYLSPLCGSENKQEIVSLHSIN